MRSLRARLLVGVIGGMLLLLTIFSLTVYAVISSALVNQFDVALLSTAQILAGSVERDGDEVDLEFEVQQMPEFNDPERPMFYQIWRHDGQVVARSPLLGTDDLTRFEGSVNKPAFRGLQRRNGRHERSVGLKFLPRTEGPDHEVQSQPNEGRALSLVLACDASGLYRQLSLLRRLLLLTSIAVIALSALVAIIVVRRGLNPLNSIAAEIGAITERDLSTRIGDASAPTEIVPIRDRLNDLLSRLQDAFNRERRFTGDVAHELRTPLAGIRSTIEVALTRIRQTDEY